MQRWQLGEENGAAAGVDNEGAQMIVGFGDEAETTTSGPLVTITASHLCLCMRPSYSPLPDTRARVMRAHRPSIPENRTHIRVPAGGHTNTDPQITDGRAGARYSPHGEPICRGVVRGVRGWSPLYLHHSSAPVPSTAPAPLH